MSTSFLTCLSIDSSRNFVLPVLFACLKLAKQRNAYCSCYLKSSCVAQNMRKSLDGCVLLRLKQLKENVESWWPEMNFNGKQNLSAKIVSTSNCRIILKRTVVGRILLRWNTVCHLSSFLRVSRNVGNWSSLTWSECIKIIFNHFLHKPDTKFSFFDT